MTRLGPDTSSITLAKLQNPVKQSFDGVNNDLKEVYKGLNNYSKAMDKVQALLKSSLVVFAHGFYNPEVQGQTTTHDRL